MEYIIVGTTAHIANFTGDFDELVNYFPATLLAALEFQGVTKVVWGLEGENYEELSEFPKLEP